MSLYVFLGGIAISTALLLPSENVVVEYEANGTENDVVEYGTEVPYWGP